MRRSGKSLSERPLLATLYVRLPGWGNLTPKRQSRKLRTCLSSNDWQILISHRSNLPQWMAEAIGREAVFAEQGF